MKKDRIESLDLVRGIALIFIIFFHSSIYNFANIHKIDFSNPPIFIVLMSFMALWGGIFILYSMAVNSYMIAKRSEEEVLKKTFLMLTYAALFYIAVHYALNLALGRWNVDFVNNMPHMTMVAATIRNGCFTLPSRLKFFDGSSISTILSNILIVGWLLYFLLKRKTSLETIYSMLAISGTAVIMFSFVRVFLFKYCDNAASSGNWILGTIYSFILANPYPIITYVSYGLFGALLGLLIYNDRRDLMKKILLPIGGMLFLFGISGMAMFDKTISKPDFFWYFKTNFELGFFLFSITLIYLFFEGRKKLLSKLSFISNFSRISLTVYLLEVTLSEILGKGAGMIFPDWNQTINGALLFGFVNVCVWLAIVALWSRAKFKYSLEYFWVKLFKRLGKDSTKIMN